jgi:general secretion pathway protein A
MYERFFGFRDQPFRLTPDPKYLYLGSKHREGYAHLLYALREGSGFVAVTGEVGTGKTTLVRSLLRESHADIAVAYIFNPVLSSVELLQTINSEFGLPSRSTSKKELVETLNAFLLAQKADGGRAVIIVDEAQNLDPQVLEQLRLLSNLETETDKLLQIVLLGQPELRPLLDRTDLRQLAQRISLRWHLEPLDRKEVHGYVEHRVQVAGGRKGLFDAKAVDLIHELSGGIPRLINILAHRSLLVAYTKAAKKVGAPEVHLAAAELEQCRIPLRARSGRPRAWMYQAAGVAFLVVAAGAVAFLLVAPLVEDAHTNAERQAVAKLPGKTTTPKPPAASTGTGKKEPQAKTTPSRTDKASAPDSRSGAVRPTATGGVTPDEAPLVGGPELEKRLSASDPYQVAASAMSRLVELWTAQPIPKDELATGELDLRLLGARRNLRYVSVDLTPSQLQRLDLPAVVELHVGAQSEPRYVLVEGVDDEEIRIFVDSPLRVSRNVVEQSWSRNVHLLWRDVERLSKTMKKGETGPAVAKLQKMLAEVGVLKSEPTGQYDGATEQAVRRVQRKYGLEENGEASTLTQIILYNAIPRYEHPDLVGARKPPVGKTLS